MLKGHEDKLTILENLKKLNDVRLASDGLENSYLFFDLAPRVVLIEGFFADDF